MPRFLLKEKFVLPGLVILGIVLITSGMKPFLISRQATPEANATQPEEHHIVQIAFSKLSEQPFLLTDDGQLLIPDGNDFWQKANTDEAIHHIYIDNEAVIWAATDKGLQVHSDGEWEAVDATPIAVVLPLEGDAIKIAEDGRVMGSIKGQILNMPDGALSQALTIGNDTSILQTDTGTFISVNVDEWIPLDAPEAVQGIWDDGEGHLLANTAAGIMRWWWEDDRWETISPIYGDAPFEDLQAFHGTIFAVAQGDLLRYVGEEWQAIDLNPDAYFSQIDVQNSERIWVLDRNDMRLWSSEDGETWSEVPIKIMQPATTTPE